MQADSIFILIWGKSLRTIDVEFVSQYNLNTVSKMKIYEKVERL